jgi:hypothetical protein
VGGKDQKVQDEAKSMAQDILALYAARDAIKRAPCAPDGPEFKKFEGKINLLVNSRCQIFPFVNSRNIFFP